MKWGERDSNLVEIVHKLFVCLDQAVPPFPSQGSVAENLNSSHCFPFFFSLLLLVLVEEIGLIPQGEKAGNAEKLAEYICSSKWL